MLKILQLDYERYYDIVEEARRRFDEVAERYGA